MDYLYSKAEVGRIYHVGQSRWWGIQINAVKEFKSGKKSWVHLYMQKFSIGLITGDMFVLNHAI